MSLARSCFRPVKRGLAQFLLLCSLLFVAGTGASPALAQLAPPGEAAMASYRLSVGDHLAVIVYGEDKISGPVTIDPEGAITLPLAGRIAAEDKTIGELTEAIRAALAAGYLRRPSVAVQMVSPRPFYILGEVNKPGQYEYTKGLTVMDAVAIAAGFTYRARKRAVFITHRGEASEVREAVTPGLMVRPGDTIRVGERYF